MNLRRRYLRDRIMVAFVYLGTLVVLLPLGFILVHVFLSGVGALNWDFFTKPPAPPGEPGGGMLPAIVGTFVIDLMALAMGGALGLGGGVLMAEYPEHPLNRPLRLVANVLGGVPAILMGLFAFVVVVLPMGGFSAFSGSVALAVLMIPIIMRATEEVLRMLPWELREAGLALGLPRWRVTLSLVLPAAKGGIVTGLLLALARAAGEAAPLLFTAFGNSFLSFDPLGPMDSLPLKIYVYAISPYEDWIRQAWGAALLLVLLLMVTNYLARRAVRR
ncbi:MAG TPA: phosphate ABC transporter permease PstA [Oceanithermus profundus]|uniref:Phosphate transport system permease protein PstA n=1 Tax=Oceanithermus profundus TaxID=187137 RepID=A0A7C4V4R9_9DEIN|nr:phosphate ABC transporter permease PstA [Oceanithermus profundus]